MQNTLCPIKELESPWSNEINKMKNIYRIALSISKSRSYIDMPEEKTTPIASK